MNITNFSMDFANSNPMAQELITKTACLDLHGPLLTQLMYLKIVIGFLVLSLILFILIEYKRKMSPRK